MKKTNTSRDRWTRFLSALLCFVMILGVTVTPKASAAATTLQLGEAYYIKETTTGRYLTVNGGKDYNFNPVGVNPLVSAPSQRWVVRASSYGGYQLFPECSTTRILDVSSGQTDIYLNKGCKNYNSFFITGNPFTGCQISNQGKYLYAESGKANKWSYVKVSSTTSSTWIFEPVNPVAAAPNEYTVTFYVDGEAYDTQTVEENCTADMVEEPYLNGCYFEGWFEEGAEDPYDFSPVTESIDLYAKFTVPVNVFYTICGVYESDTLFFPYGECIDEEDLPLELERGMVSGGWFLDTSFTNKFDFTQPLAEPTDLFLKPELKTHVIGYFVNGNLNSMEFVLDRSMANLPSKINRAPVVWYLDEEMTTPYSARPVTDSFNLYTHVLVETDEYQIFDAETHEMLVYNRSLCRTQYIYPAAVDNEIHDTNWHIQESYNSTGFNIRPANTAEYVFLTGNGTISLVTKAEKEPAIDILKYVNTSTAESVSDFSPQETYWINGISQVTWNEAESDGKLFHIVNVEDLNLLPELSYETKLNLLIEELNNADDEDTDEIWNELGFTEEEKYFLLVYGDASSFMTEAEHVNKSILKLTNLANRLGNPLETVLQQQFLIVNNDLNWYYLESMVEKAERSEMVEFCISRAGSLNLYTKALVTCYKFSKMFEKANDSYMSKLDRRQATYAAYDSICVDLSNILLYEFSPLTKAYLKATGESLPFVTKEIANRVQKEFTKHIIDEAYEPLSQ